MSGAPPTQTLENPGVDVNGQADKLLDVAELRARISTLEMQLAQLSAVQAAMAQGISHDLRAPLRAIDGFAMQLARELDSDEAASQQVAKIRAAAARMGGLTESLIEYARMASAPLQLTAVDIPFLVDWAVMDLRGQYPDLDIDAQVQADLEVAGDERLLRVFFDKVLDNSRKFTRQGNGTSVRIRGERTDEGIHIEVSDDGIGMTMRNAEQPFEPFMRLHGHRDGAGDGLGLAIAQAVVLRHGGRIWAESGPGKGTTVHAVLPGFPPTTKA